MTTNNIPALPQVRDLVQNNRPLAEEEAEIARLPWMLRLTALTFVALVAGGLAERAAAPDWTAPALFLLAYAAGGFFSVQQAWATLNARQFDVNVLMIVAAIGAALIGEPQEGAILMFLFSLSNTLETFAMGRTHASVRALLDLSPREAEVYRDGVLMRVPVESLRVGQVVLVRPGAQIPADGLVLKGEGSVNEASITGESMPVEKRPGSRTFAGTLNGQGALEITVSTAVENSTLARIVAVVREAREQKAASQDFTDRVVGQYYAYAVVAMTLLAIIIPLFFLGWDAPTTLYRAFTLMVVASPCALVISIPATLLSALASSARGGVLFKGGRYLEAAARVRVVAFDKTGTLTTGKPQVVEIIPIDSSFELSAISHQPSALLSLAAAVEQYSEHPLARAIVGAAQERGLVIAEAQQFVALTGSGAQAEVAGRQLRIGRPDLFELGADVAAQVVAQERQGRTLVVLGAGQQPLGLIALADTLR
ncbi:MAG: heavy metal translocating P-type ATPase, partial [Roseiflexaceae bacterium]|nr:heavy metal translocating P-type ATPase [Roseiflexaceae bacterium]